MKATRFVYLSNSITLNTSLDLNMNYINYNKYIAICQTKPYNVNSYFNASNLSHFGFLQIIIEQLILNVFDSTKWYLQKNTN